MRRALLVFCLALTPVLAFAQSADQEILSVTDSPDPAVPGQNITYTVTIRNNGPDAAVNGGMNAYFPSLTYISASGPAGFTCGAFGQAASCTHPAFPAGTTAVFTLVAQLPASLVSFPDGSVTTSFSTSGVTPDPNNGNNSQDETTNYDTPQIDVTLTVTDSPDPVFPNGTITYTVPVTNNGPDTGTSGQFSMFNNGTLRFQSATVPAGWNCTLPAVGGNPTFSCTKPSLAPAATDTFTVVVLADPAILGVNDGTVSVVFGASATGNDTVPGNGQEQEDTAYVTPDADVSVAVTDSPDPVFPDGNITYTVTVANDGPDAAPSITLSSFGNNNLRFTSATVPAGWNCTLPAAGAQTAGFSCTLPAGLANGASSVLTFVLQATDELLGVNDGTIQFGFTASSTIADPVGANNTETESTAYVTPDADLAITVSDSPDPVNPDNNVTFTVQVTNNGPDTAQNVNLNVAQNGSLRFVSASVPAGWNCTLPSVGGTPNFTCSIASFANAASSTFTIVLLADDANIGINDTTLVTAFSVSSSTSDPTGSNNSESEQTAYVTPDADLAISVSDSPDPVTPDNNVTFTVQVTNNGPDAAQNVTLNVAQNGSLRFVSASVPAGWNCTLPAVGGSPNFSCSIATFANAASSTFTIVLLADDANIGINDTTLVTAFSVSSSATADPSNGNNSESEQTSYITPDADMAVSVGDSPDPVTPNNDVTYTVQVTNNGPDTATNATLNSVNGGTLRFQSASVPAGWNCTLPGVNAAPTFTCTNPSFANGATSTFTIVARADGALLGIHDGTVSTSFTVGSGAADPNNTNNSETEDTAYVTPDADLAVTNSDSPDPVAPGGTITYTQTITNNGPDSAPNVTFAQVLPGSVGFQSITAPAGFNCTTPAVGASGTVTCTNPSLASGASGTFTLVVTVLAASGTVTDTVTASSTIEDPDNTDNSATVVTTILAPDIADLAITKNTNSTNAGPGSTLAYTITLTNNGPDDATNVVVSDVLPASLLFQSIVVPTGFTCTTPAVDATGTITCNAATFVNGATATFTLIVEVAGNATGTINNTASATSDTGDNTPGNSSGNAAAVTVGGTATADLGVSKSSTTTEADPGDPVTYTITVTNFGPGTADDVVVTDDLPAELLFQSITPAAGFTCATPPVGSSGTILCTGGSLADGATATFTLVTTIAPDASGSIVNGVAVGTSDSDPDPGDSSTTSPGVVMESADLSITKTTPATSAPTGSTLTYTLTVSNAGPDAATNVVVVDDLPAGLQFVSATPSQGTCNASDPITCNLGGLAIGGSATITIQALVTATSGTITNTATVSATEDDPNPGNNEGTTAPVPVTPAAAPAAAIPTMSEWALIALAAMLGMLARLKMRI